MHKALLAGSTAVLLWMAAGSATASGLDVAGLWLTGDGNAHVEVKDCGDATPCGYLRWIDPEATDEKFDINNPEEELRTRELKGMRLLWGFERRDERWRKGNVYDPETGRTYNAGMRMAQDGTMRMKGCVLFICDSQTWTRLDPAEAGRLRAARAPEAQ